MASGYTDMQVNNSKMADLNPKEMKLNERYKYSLVQTRPRLVEDLEIDSMMNVFIAEGGITSVAHENNKHLGARNKRVEDLLDYIAKSSQYVFDVFMKAVQKSQSHLTKAIKEKAEEYRPDYVHAQSAKASVASTPDSLRGADAAMAESSAMNTLLPDGDRQRLTNCMELIISSLTCLGAILDRFRANDVIDMENSQRIKSAKTEVEQRRHLVDFILDSNRKVTFDLFMDVLRKKQPHIAAALKAPADGHHLPPRGTGTQETNHSADLTTRPKQGTPGKKTDIRGRGGQQGEDVSSLLDGLRLDSIDYTDGTQIEMNWETTEPNCIPKMSKQPAGQGDHEGKKQSYSMVRVNGYKGKVCIIGIHSFPKTSWRTLHGYKQDTQDLNNLWESLGFQVSIPKGRGECLTGKEIEAAVEKFARTLRKNDQCAILCFSSHGGEGEVYGSDGVPVKVADLLVKLNNVNCKEMAGKPKVVIFQACQGEKEDRGKRVTAGSMPDLHLPTVSDLIVCTPSLQGHVSFVCGHEADDSKIPCGPECGSEYMQALVQVFTEYARSEDILTMLTMVNHEVAKKGIKYKNEDYKQMPEFRSTLTKQLFFYDKV